jgi:hypothetical protein
MIWGCQGTTIFNLGNAMFELKKLWFSLRMRYLTQMFLGILLVLCDYFDFNKQ